MKGDEAHAGVGPAATGSKGQSGAKEGGPSKATHRLTAPLLPMEGRMVGEVLNRAPSGGVLVVGLKVDAVEQ